MSTSYPGALDSYSIKVDGVDDVLASHINNLQDAMVAVQTAIGQEGNSALCEGRLTLTSGTPVLIADVTAATTIYFSPFRGGRLALHNGTGWVTGTFSELSIAVPGTTVTMYDIFVYLSGGTPTLEAVAWTNDTTRATALTTLDGVYVKSGATTRRYLGSFRTTGVSGQTEVSLNKVFLCNYYNRFLYPLKRYAADSHTYTSSTVRVFNNNTAHIVEFVQGVVEDVIKGDCRFGIIMPSNSGPFRLGFSLNSTTAYAGEGMYLANGAGGSQLTIAYFTYGRSVFPRVGYNFMHPMEGTDTTPSPTYSDYYFDVLVPF